MLKKLKNLKSEKVVEIKNQKLLKKSPWPKVIISLIFTIIFIVLVNHLNPHLPFLSNFFDILKKLFNFKTVSKGLAKYTIADTFYDSLTLLGRTIAISFIGTFFGIIIAIPLAFLSAKNISKKRIIYLPLRTFSSVLRAFPPLIIAFIMSYILSSTLSGVATITIFISTIMTKWVYEELDSIDLGAYESLQAFGNTKFRAARKAIFPIIMPKLLSLSLYSFEIVLRFSAILGLVGIPTIGRIIQENGEKQSYFGHMSISLYILIITIICFELFSYIIKKYIINATIKIDNTDISKLSKKEQIQITMQKKPKTWIVKMMILGGFAVIFIWSTTRIEWGLANDKRIESFNDNFPQLFKYSWSEMIGSNGVIKQAWNALLQAIVASIIGVMLGLVMGILAAKNITSYWSWFSKIIIIIIRTVPVFVYAYIIVLLAKVENFQFAGAVALGVHSVGMLGKLTYEKMESIDTGGQQALKVMGVRQVLITKYAIISEAIPTIVSNGLYRIEINFKSTIQIGFVGLSTFGQNIKNYAADALAWYRLGNYILISIIIILIIEQVSNILRTKLMTGNFFKQNNIIKKWLRTKFILLGIVNIRALGLDKSLEGENIKIANYYGIRSLFNKEIFAKQKSNYVKTINEYKKYFNESKVAFIKHLHDTKRKYLSERDSQLKKELKKYYWKQYFLRWPKIRKNSNNQFFEGLNYAGI